MSCRGVRHAPTIHVSLKRFLWTHTEGDLALHLVVGPMLQVGDAELLMHLVSKARILLSESARRVHVSQPLRRTDVTGEGVAGVDGVRPPRVTNTLLRRSQRFASLAFSNVGACPIETTHFVKSPRQPLTADSGLAEGGTYILPKNDHQNDKNFRMGLVASGV